MKFPEILPPNDLLKQVEGIESGLRQRKRLGIIGVLATLVQAVVLIANHHWFDQLLDREWLNLVETHWPSLLMLAGVVLFLLLAGYARFWLQESRAPFRYTYSIADFKPLLAEKAEGPKEDRISVHLSHDLAEKLNERIKRLALLDEDDAKREKENAVSGDQPQLDSKRKSHIHIRGFYVIRTKPDGQWFVEVMPRVRIGPPGSAETLAHPVKYKLPRGDESLPVQSLIVHREEADSANTGQRPIPAVSSKEEAPPTMTARQYEQILERVYFSVATEIYKQIQLDVKRKIDLLPTNYYRAVALFHEAEDYANSNTLDAYQDARKLYAAALNYFDPDWKPLSKFFLWRWIQGAYRWFFNFWLAGKRFSTKVMPRLGRLEVMCARAEIGYANMLLYRRVLAGLSGQKINASFEAPLVAEQAVKRLKGMSEDVTKRRRNLFDAYVTLALARYYTGAPRAAEKNLSEARALDPVYAEMDSRYLFVAGEVEPRGRSKLYLLRRAVELDPRFEVAQFSLAYQVEMLWRMWPSFERSAAELLFKEYDEVLKLNPGNIGAWANRGYILWLLSADDADLRKAREAFEYGREYKEIKRETFVAELDYGLARIAAEEGDFDTAYSHYASAVSAHLAQGMRYGADNNLLYFFQLINRTLLQRIVVYKEKVESNFKMWAERDQQGSWRNRSFQEVARDLTDRLKKDAVIDGIESLFRCISHRITPADREQMKDLIGEADLRLLVKQLGTAAGRDTLTKLRSPGFAKLIEKYLPTLRVRKSVYAYVLNEYGEACDNYYFRSGSEVWRKKGREAYQDAKDLDAQYVVPRYRLYRMESWEHRSAAAESWLKEIVDIEPDWPDGVLALAEVKARLAKDKSREAEEAFKEAGRLQAAVAESERRLRAETSVVGTSVAVETRHLRTIDDNRLLQGAGRAAALGKGPGVAASLRKLSAVGREDQTAISQQRQNAANQEKFAWECKSKEKDLAKEAVDGIRKLLPFKWAENALNEELEQSARTPKEAEGRRRGKRRRPGKVVRSIRRLSVFRWLTSADDDAAGKEISALLENKDIVWERELEDIHVQALRAWGNIRPLLAEHNTRRYKGRVVLPGEELLCHIRRHFWPDSFELHLTLRDLSKPVFSWEAVPGDDDEKLTEFLAYSLGAKWMRRASIKKPNKTSIVLSKGKRAFTLNFDDQQERATLVLSGIHVEKKDDKYCLRFPNHEMVGWEDIPGSDSRRLRDLLQKSLGAKWLRDASIVKSNDDTAITLSNGDHSLSLKLDHKSPKATLIAREFKVAKVEKLKHDIRFMEYESASNEVIRDSLKRDWNADRTSFSILSWETDRCIDEEEQIRVFSLVSKEDGLPDSLYKWLGDQWFKLGGKTLMEFVQAMQAKDQTQAARALKNAGENIAQGIAVYRKALEISDGD